MGSEERKGRRERLGDKVSLAKSFLTLSGRRTTMMPGSGSPKANEKEGASSRGGSPYSSPSQVRPLTLLFLHSRNDNVDELKELLQNDRDLARMRDYDERTALHIAATHGCLNAAKVLLDNGAEVNALDRWQNSPLADAKASGHVKMMKLLESREGQLLHSCLEVSYAARYCKTLGCHGQEVNKPMAPPTLRKSDWEIDPTEIDLIHSRKIGKGSFGEIRMTSWRGTPVAVKTILPALSDDKLVAQDFRHEVELLVRVRHPNIVQFLGAVTKQPPLMLITEYLAGGDLHVVLKESKSPLSAATIVHYALDIARGLTYLHNGPNMIIHRDLKPRNVLVGENNQLKVGDFGLSKLIRAKSMHDIYKMTGETGSYRYMAPEVFEHRAYDKSVDVFSFAVILYELMTSSWESTSAIFDMFEGTTPFANLDAYEAARVVAKEKRRPFFLSKHYPDGMAELIGECWQCDPAERPEFQNIIPRLEKMSTNLVVPQREHHLWPFTTSHSSHSSS